MPSSPSPTSSPPAKTLPVEPAEKAEQTEEAGVTFRGPFGGPSVEPIKNGPRPSMAGSGAASSQDGRRRSTVQFHTAEAESTIRRESLAKPPKLPSTSRRMSSPPPPSTYQRGVSFDTFDNRDATDFSLTLNYKHKDYRNTRRSRTFLCGTDQKDYSEFALEWLLDELVDDGDEIVCLRVVEKDSKIASENSVEQGRYHKEAQKLLDSVIAKNSQDEKAISLIMELAMGRVQEIIQRMIQIYEPAVLIVGTRGRSLGGMQGLLPGSVSKYCLQSSPIPVIVVRPSSKRLRKKKKRLADPTRRMYGSILEQTGGALALNNPNSIVAPLPSATDQEAAAVAKAIGLPTGFEKGDYGVPVRRRRSSIKSLDIFNEAASSTLIDAPLVADPATKAMRSPMFNALEWTDDEMSEEEGIGKSPKQKPKPRADSGAESTTDEKKSPPIKHEDPPWLKAILEKDDKRAMRRFT